jgi:hypothetical protein
MKSVLQYKDSQSFSVRRIELLVCLLAAIAIAAGANRGIAQPSQSARSVPTQDGDGSAYATTVAYVEHFYPLWFTYNQSRLNNLAGTSNRMAGPVKMSPICSFVVASNDDTLYASAFLHLRAEPVILTIPATRVTYSILIVDAYGNIMPEVIPPETPGVYALTGPGFSGKLPQGVTPVSLPVNFSVVFFRADKFSSTGEDQSAQASAFRESLKSQPLSGYVSDPGGGSARIVSDLLLAPPFKTTADLLIQHSPILFLGQLQKAVAAPNTPPLSPSEQAVSTRFNALLNDPRTPRSEFRAGARKAHQLILDNYLTHTGPTNWIHFTNIGEWGDNVLDRAATTEFLQFSNGIGTAAYYHAFRDKAGRPLDGSEQKGYTLTFPAGALPKAKRFWSLTAYTPETIELVPNRAHKYVVASYTPGLKYDDDGSVTIFMTRRVPTGVPTANWLPTPNGPFNIVLRVYGPEGDVANNTYLPPSIQKD